MREKFEIGEQHLDHARAIHEIRDVGLGDRAPDRLELSPDRQILETEASPTVSMPPSSIDLASTARCCGLVETVIASFD
jgi:hypothetical protein